MKTIKMALLSLVLAASYNCKETSKEVKENVDEIEAVAAAEYSLVQDSTKVSFTAYKTSEKLPVGGKFTKINFTNSTSGVTPLDALNGAAFSIPVSSLFTNDATGTRDPKLLEFFFGAMENTTLISGTVKVSADEKCSIDVALNGKTGNIPLEVEKTAENRYTFKGVMDLKNWDALAAVASINKACEALHTGKDGVSKTWNDVAVQAEVLLQKK